MKFNKIGLKLNKKILNLILLLLTALIMSSCSAAKAREEKTEITKIKSVKGYLIKEAEKYDKYNFPGEIKPEKEINLSFRVSGPVSEFTGETGTKVKKNQLIAKIDERDFIVKINSLKARLEASKARLKDSKLQYQRYSSLFKENAESKSVLDKSESEYKALKSKTKELETMLEQAKNALEDTNLRSPVNGYINQIYGEKHETIASGQPIVSIVDTSSIEIEIFIPEFLISRQKNFENFNFSIPSSPNKIFKADLKETGQKATGAGQTYPLLLKTMPNHLIKAGMSAMVSFSIPSKKQKKAYSIPVSAIVSKSDKKTIVWKIDNEKNMAIKIPVEVLALNNLTTAEVSGSLNKGDWIVTAGANYINEKTKIKLMPLFSKTNIGQEL